jgi:RNA polymerase sigma-70 factor (ECF subfamily)
MLADDKVAHVRVEAVEEDHARALLLNGRGDPLAQRGAYLRAASGIRHGTGLLVLTLAGDRISSVTRFDTSVLPWFGLPRSLPSR